MKVIRTDHILDADEAEVSLDQIWFDIEYAVKNNKLGAVEKLERKIDLLYSMFRDHTEGKSQAEVLVNAGNNEAYGYTYRIEEIDDTAKQN